MFGMRRFLPVVKYSDTMERQIRFLQKVMTNGDIQHLVNSAVEKAISDAALRNRPRPTPAPPKV